MNDFYEQISNMSPKRLMLLAMELQSKVEDLERAKAEPVAVVGIGCRFPGGVNSPESFWDLLRNGKDAITDIPAGRWDVNAYYDPDPDAPGKIATRWGGFIDDVDRFEPQLFGISPREALTMDPQQRVLLEVVWEALERAGYAPSSLNGSQTGVFVGVCNSDYSNMLVAGDPAEWDMYISTGNAHSVISGRVSYILGLHGPALSVDTACSSSLVAVHLAVQSLRRGECRMALAAGTNAILSPLSTIMLSRAGMMASDGHCKAFDASADGFVRSEGCGVVVLKRLSDALADGDNVLAVIRGSAINQDGRSNGLTAPNGPSQVSVIKAALADAQVTPEEVSYIETHGTGTSLGDPIEAQALGAALGVGHSSDNPLIIGSLKANMGHMESAAGIGGLIKTVLMLQHGEIPPQLHLNELNPYIPWSDLPLKLVKEVHPWQPVDGSRIAGVSSFGFSGTNAHVLLESAPLVETATPETERPQHLIAFSARTQASLHQLAAEFRDYLSRHPAESLGDIAYTAHLGRSAFVHRLAVTGATADEVASTLTAFLQDQKSDQVATGRATNAPDLAFLFTGHGSQYVNMGRRLYEEQVIYRQAFDRCDELFRPFINLSLSEIIFSSAGADGTLLNQMTYAQPALFALQYALGQLWLAWGIKPTVMLGHSLGEYAAACLAGVFSLEDGVKLVAARGRLFDALPETGEMVAVFGDEATIAAAVKPYANRVSIAAINGETNIVISGASDALESVLETLKSQKIKSRKLAVAQAAHSPLLEPILDEFESIARTVEYHEPDVVLVSGLTGKPVSAAEITTAHFWRSHLRQTVRFADALQTVYEQGIRIFLEVGPNPTLLGMAQRVLPPAEAVWLTSLRDTTDDWTQLLSSLGGLYCAGVAVDWQAYDADYARHKVVLPTYPFHRERYWMIPDTPKATVRGQGSTIHPLIGQQLRSPSLGDHVFETQLNAQYPAFLSHHRIFDVVILPSPAYIEMVTAAAGLAFGDQSYAVENFSIDEALILPEDQLATVQIILSPNANGRSKFEIFSQVENDWKRHASGSILFAPPPAPAFALDVEAFQSQSTGQLSGDDYYALVSQLGLEFGTNFKGITHLWYTHDNALAELHLPHDLLAESHLYGIHPALLDACFHAVGAPFMNESLESAYLLIGIDRFQLYQSPGTHLWVHVELERPTGPNPEILTGTIRLVNENGTLVAESHGLQLKRAARAALLQTRQRVNEWLYDIEWQPKPHPQPEYSIIPADFIPPLPQLTQAGLLELRQLAATPDVQSYEAFNRALNAVSTAYVVQALIELGVKFQLGESIQPTAFPIVAEHQSLFGRLLHILAEDGLIQPNGQGWQVLQSPQVFVPDAQLAALIDQYPDFAPEAVLVQRCAPRLADVLQGYQDPLELLFPNGSLELTGRLYSDMPFARIYNTVIKQFVEKLVAALPYGRRLRILEIGAGTGSTTQYIIPSLPADRTEYVFTDLSPAFLNRAHDKFGDSFALRTLLLDIEKDPQQQGLPSQYFDIVIASNVLHATADLHQSLANVHKLLAPDGVALFLEGTHPQRWVDLTFGLTEGWWRFVDKNLRPDYPLLSQDRWLQTLMEVGFSAAEALPGSDDPGLLASQAVLLARAPQAPVSVSVPQPTSNSLIFADNSGVASALSAQLIQRGENPILVAVGESYQQIDSNHWQLNPHRRDDFTRLWDEVRSLNKLPCNHVVYLWALDTPYPAEKSPSELQSDQLETSSSVLWLTQTLLAANDASSPSLWLVTRGAVPAAAESMVNVAQSALWGLGRVIGLEHPQIWGGLVDLDAASYSADDLLNELLNSDGEDQVAWRHGIRHVARLIRATPIVPQPITLYRDASYLVTGALGGLGLNIAHWMAEQGAGHLILTSRSGLPDRSTWDAIPPESRAARQVEAIRAIEALGTTVTVAAVDVGDESAMTQLLQQVGQSLRGVIHAAADQNSTAIADLDSTRLQAMFQPKIAGTWVLHQLTRHLELDFFVLFSSTTALWGSKQLAHYAAANAFLDAFAHYRHQLGLPALSINWGTWDVMRVSSALDQQFVSQSGLDQMPSNQALQLMGDLLGSRDRAQIVIAAVDWERLKAVYEARRERPLLALVASPRQPVRAVQTAAKASDLLERLNAAPVDKHFDMLIDYIRAQVALVLRVSEADSIDVNQGLFEMGMDSLMSVELKSRLEVGVEQSLPSTLTFNYPTVIELAEYLQQKLGLSSSTAAEVQPEPVTQSPASVETLPDDMDDMSEDELAELLAKKLGFGS